MKTASGADPVMQRKRMLYSPTACGFSLSMSVRVVTSTSFALIDPPPARLHHHCRGLPPPRVAQWCTVRRALSSPDRAGALMHGMQGGCRPFVLQGGGHVAPYRFLTA